jgi:hypothetical protein
VVNLIDGVLLELGVEGAVGLRRASQDDHPTGGAVQTVDDPQAAKFRLEQLSEVGACGS